MTSPLLCFIIMAKNPIGIVLAEQAYSLASPSHFFWLWMLTDVSQKFQKPIY